MSGNRTLSRRSPNRELGKLAPGEGDLIREQLAPHRAAIVAKLAELAALGDPRSMQLALQYLARPEGERVNVPALAEGQTLAEKGAAIVEAVARGAISAEAGSALLGLVDKMARIIAIDEHDRRLDALESGRRPVKPAADVVDIEDIA